MAQIQPFILEPEYSSEEELLEDELDELDLPVNVNAGRLRNSSWCKCGECSEMPTEMECVCCREMKNIEKMIESKFTRLRGYLLEISVISFKPSCQGFLFGTIILPCFDTINSELHSRLIFFSFLLVLFSFVILVEG